MVVALSNRSMATATSSSSGCASHGRARRLINRRQQQSTRVGFEIKLALDLVDHRPARHVGVGASKQTPPYGASAPGRRAQRRPTSATSIAPGTGGIDDCVARILPSARIEPPSTVHAPQRFHPAANGKHAAARLQHAAEAVQQPVRVDVHHVRIRHCTRDRLGPQDRHCVAHTAPPTLRRGRDRTLASAADMRRPDATSTHARSSHRLAASRAAHPRIPPADARRTRGSTTSA